MSAGRALVRVFLLSASSLAGLILLFMLSFHTGWIREIGFLLLVATYFAGGAVLLTAALLVLHFISRLIGKGRRHKTPDSGE